MAWRVSTPPRLPEPSVEERAARAPSDPAALRERERGGGAHVRVLVLGRRRRPAPSGVAERLRGPAAPGRVPSRAARRSRHAVGAVERAERQRGEDAAVRVPAGVSQERHERLGAGQSSRAGPHVGRAARQTVSSQFQDRRDAFARRRSSDARRGTRRPRRTAARGGRARRRPWSGRRRSSLTSRRSPRAVFASGSGKKIHGGRGSSGASSSASARARAPEARAPSRTARHGGGEEGRASRRAEPGRDVRAPALSDRAVVDAVRRLSASSSSVPRFFVPSTNALNFAGSARIRYSTTLHDFTRSA